MSDTRQAWKPCRATTFTAASRMIRRLSAAARGLAEHDLVARLLVAGLAVLAALHGDVEHVQLAVERPDLASGAGVNAGVAQLRLARFAHRAQQVDAELARGCSHPRHRRAV